MNGLVFTLLFWVRAYQAERKSDMIFGFVLLTSCLYITDWMLGFMGIHVLWQELFFIPYDIGLIIAPLMYFYLKSQLDTTFKFSKTDCWHLAPYLVYIIYHFAIFSQGREFTKTWADTIHFPYYLGDLEMIMILISNFTYLFLAFRLYRHYQKWLPTQYSNTETISFAWYRNFLLVYALAIIVNWVYIFLEMSGFHFSYIDIWWEKFLVGIIIYYVSIKGYTQIQPKLLVFKEKEQNNHEENSIEKGESENILPDLEIWKAKLLRAVNEDKLYLDPELSLSELASKLNTHNSLLSVVINKGFGKNFNDFINEYRVKEFQHRVKLDENQHLTLLGIAFDCGFNSKATFNRVLKKMTGKSPKEHSKSM